jgi:uncharacterized protein YggE
MGKALAIMIALLATSAPVRGQFYPVDSQAARDTTVITATGSGTVWVTADRAVLYADVGAQQASVDGAARTTIQARTSLVEALVDAGLSPDDISLTGFAAGPDPQYGPFSSPGGGAPPSEARTGVRIVVEPIGRLDDIVATVLSSGAESIHAVLLELSDREPYRREAAQLGLADARSQAEAVAEAGDSQLGRLLHVVVHAEDYSEATSLARITSPTSRNQVVQLLPSNLVVRVNVQATWAFQRR